MAEKIKANEQFVIPSSITQDRLEEILIDQNVKCEVHSAKDRADCIAETDEYVYIFEFKLDQMRRQL